MTEQQTIDAIGTKLALKTFKAASDKGNYAILTMLPCTSQQVMERLQLTKMPAYKRLNELEKVGLVKWKRRESQLAPTDLAIKVLVEMECMMQMFREHPEMILETQR